jgi:DNA-binding FrmR family transcriptional regulator
MVRAMKHAAHDSQLSRLRRIEGQLAGIARMVEEKRYCVDLLTQLRAARTAIKRVEEQILREHVEHCVVNAVRVGKKAEQQQKIDELLDVIARFGG